MKRRTVLKGGLILAVTGHTAAGVVSIADPLLDTIRQFRAGEKAYNAIPMEHITDANRDHLVQATYGAAMDRLDAWEAPALSREGAIEALKLMEEQDVFIDVIGESMRKAVLGYLESLPA